MLAAYLLLHACRPCPSSRQLMRSRHASRVLTPPCCVHSGLATPPHKLLHRPACSHTSCRRWCCAASNPRADRPAAAPPRSPSPVPLPTASLQRDIRRFTATASCQHSSLTSKPHSGHAALTLSALSAAAAAASPAAAATAPQLQPLTGCPTA